MKSVQQKSGLEQEYFKSSFEVNQNLSKVVYKAMCEIYSELSMRIRAMPLVSFYVFIVDFEQTMCLLLTLNKLLVYFRCRQSALCDSLKFGIKQNFCGGFR